ncbi:MAG: anti-sigma factor family protein [Bacteroides sp.]
MNCKDFRKMIDAFDRGHLDVEIMRDFVEHVSGCADCQEEYEIYFIMKYALSNDDELIESELAEEPPEVQKIVNSYDFKALVTYRLKAAKQRLDKLKLNEYYNKCLFVIAEFSVILMAIFYIFDNIFM